MPLTDDIRTFSGVQPNDRLTLHEVSPPAVHMLIKVPLVANAVAYKLSSSCGSAALGASGTAAISLSGCNGFADIAVVALDGTSAPIGCFFHAGVIATDLGTIDLTADTYGPFTSRNYSFFNVHDPGIEIDAFDTLATARGAVYQAYAPGVSSLGASLPVPVVAGAMDTVDVRIYPAAGLSERHVMVWGSYTTGAILDLDAQVPDYSSRPTYVLAPPSLTWSESGGTAQPDFSLAQLLGGRQGGTRQWNWSIAAPHTGTGIAFPTLPTDVFDFNLRPLDPKGVRMVDIVKVPGGWDAVRPDVFSAASPPEFATGATGTLSYSVMRP
jgi:hypothetical protein